MPLLNLSVARQEVSLEKGKYEGKSKHKPQIKRCNHWKIYDEMWRQAKMSFHIFSLVTAHDLQLLFWVIIISVCKTRQGIPVHIVHYCGNHPSDPFDVRTGMKQKCVVWLALFILATDLMMWETIADWYRVIGH